MSFKLRPVSCASSRKSGETWITLQAVIMVFSALILIFLFRFFSDLYAATSSGKDDGSIANFEKRMYPALKTLMENAAPRDYITDNYFIGKDKIGVGFDTDWDDTKKVDSKGIDSNIYKPFECGNSACLCLYDGNWNPSDPAKRSQGILSCRSEAFAGKNVVFFSEEGEVQPKTAGTRRDDVNGKYLIMYGNSWGVQRLYIEKDYKKDEDKYYIYISRIDESNENDPANIRKRQIDKIKSGIKISQNSDSESKTSPQPAKIPSNMGTATSSEIGIADSRSLVAEHSKEELMGLGEQKELLPEVKEMLDLMKEAAREDGITLNLVSGYRSFDQQKQIWNKKFSESSGNDEEKITKISQFSAVPGLSRHHWGTEIDINGGQDFSLNPLDFELNGRYHTTYLWLTKNAKNYGFCQTYDEDRIVKKEPWHWSYNPISIKLTKEHLNKIGPDDLKGLAIDGESFLTSNFEIYRQAFISDINKECLKKGITT